MNDEPLDQHTAALLDEVRAAFGEATPPRPSPELAGLFASGLTTNDNGDLSVTAASNANGSAPQTSGLPNWTRRHIDMLSNVMEQVRTRAVAAAVGAALALSGLGASGALNAPLRMISDHSAPTEECLAPTEDGATEDDATVTTEDGAAEGDGTVTTEDGATEDDGAVTTEDGAAEDCDSTDDDAAGGTDGTGGTTEDGATEDTTDDGVTDDDAIDDIDPEVADDPVDAALPAAPSTVSEAAHIHDFDEACGNHGAYVSHFARFGEEPECATTARGEGSQDEVSGDPAPPATEDEAVADAGDGDAEDSSTSAVEQRGNGKGRGAQATAAKGSRGKSGK